MRGRTRTSSSKSEEARLETPVEISGRGGEFAWWRFRGPRSPRAHGPGTPAAEVKTRHRDWNSAAIRIWARSAVSRGPGQGSLARSLALAHEVTGRRWGTTDPELCSHFSFGRTRTLQLQPAGGRGRRVGDVTTGRAKGKATNKNQGGVLEVSDARDGRLGVWAERRGWGGGGRKRTSSAAPSLKRVSSEIQLGVMR